MSTLFTKRTLAVAIVSLLSYQQADAITNKVAAGGTFGLFVQNGTVYGAGSTDLGTLGNTGNAPWTND